MEVSGFEYRREGGKGIKMIWMRRGKGVESKEKGVNGKGSGFRKGLNRKLKWENEVRKG